MSDLGKRPAGTPRTRRQVVAAPKSSSAPLILVLLLLLGGGGGAYFYFGGKNPVTAIADAKAEPDEAVRQFYTAIKAKDYRRAASFLSEELPRKLIEGAFQQVLDGSKDASYNEVRKKALEDFRRAKTLDEAIDAVVGRIEREGPPEEAKKLVQSKAEMKQKAASMMPDLLKSIADQYAKEGDTAMVNEVQTLAAFKLAGLGGTIGHPDVVVAASLPSGDNAIVVIQSAISRKSGEVHLRQESGQWRMFQAFQK